MLSCAPTVWAATANATNNTLLLQFNILSDSETSTDRTANTGRQVHHRAQLTQISLGGSPGKQREWSMCDLHAFHLHVVSAELKGRRFGVEITCVVRGADCFFFAREKRKIVVVPENGHDIVAVLVSGEARVNQKGDARTGILHVQTNRSRLRFVAKLCFGFELYFRQGVQAGQVGEVFLRSVNSVGTARPVHGVEVSGKPVEIVADELTGSIVQLEL